MAAWAFSPHSPQPTQESITLATGSVRSGSGEGFTVVEGQRFNWHTGTVIQIPYRAAHQHFNTGATRTRYLATGVGSIRYPMFSFKKRASGVGGQMVAVSTSTKLGGDQIEYEDQDPRIHPLYVEEMRKSGVPHKMDKYFPEKDAAE